LSSARSLRPADRARPRSRIVPGAAVSAEAADRGPCRLPGRARRRRAAFCPASGTRPRSPHPGAGGPAHPRARCRAVVRTRARQAGAGATAGAGPRDRTLRRRTATLRAGASRAVRPATAAGDAVGATARTLARAPGRGCRARRAGAGRPSPGAAAGPRPGWLLAKPVPLRGPMPQLLAGPERIESGWWDAGDVRRDYYRARLATGQCAWVFHPVGGGGFMLHGWFA